MSARFDYVIVGAGTAGCVLADRLSEGGRSVLLLEAGGTDRRPDVMIPGAASSLHRSSADWGFYTEPQAALGGRRVYVPRGKVLGGSGSTNTLIAIRGVPLDYDEWAEAGATGWGWSEVAPVFARIARKMPARPPTWTHPLWHTYLAAARELAQPINDDGFSSDELEGLGLYAFHVKSGRRLSTARAYLRPAMRRSNLTVWTAAQVRGLRFEGARCMGVTVRRGGPLGGTIVDVDAGEVVLSAGAIGSPHLLLLAGIGPAEHLRAIGVKPRHDLPVGEGLQDHAIVHVADLSRRPTVNTTIESAGEALRYLTRGEDSMLAWPLPGAGGFVRTAPGPRPDVQLHFVAGWADDPHDYAGRPMEDGYILASTVTKPQSRGHVQLASPFPEEPPAIDPALLTHDDDFATMRRGVMLCRRLLDARAFDGWRAGPARPRGVLDEATVDDFVRTACGTTYHPSCTCAIGRVVEPDLRVKGLEGLRVVDASVMPSVTTANTNLPTIAIAERAADLMG